MERWFDGKGQFGQVKHSIYRVVLHGGFFRVENLQSSDLYMAYFILVCDVGLFIIERTVLKKYEGLTQTQESRNQNKNVASTPRDKFLQISFTYYHFILLTSFLLSNRMFVVILMNVFLDLSFILSPFFHFVPNLILMSIRMHLIQKFVVFKK